LTDRTDARRLCPTRTSGVASLIAHWITPLTCLERQRANYHKCFTCQYRGLSASAVLPPTLPPKQGLPRELVTSPDVEAAPPVHVAPRRRRSRVKVSRAG